MPKKIIIIFLITLIGASVFGFYNYYPRILASLSQKNRKIEEIDKDGMGNSLFVNKKGVPMVSYVLNDGKLVFAEKNNNKWQKEIVSKDAFVGHQTSINSTRDGQISILFINKESKLMLATKKENNWIIEDVFRNAALFCNLVFDSQDNPHISFWSPQKGILYAKKENKKWQVEVLDYGQVGWWNDIVLDKEQLPHISYFDFRNGDILYLTLKHGNWKKEIVDFGENVGRWNSIAKDEDENIFISYVDADKGNLKMAKKTENGWLIETVDKSGAVGEETNIAIDKSGNPLIAYSVFSDNSFRIAKKNKNAWNFYVIDRRLDVSQRKMKGDIGGNNSFFVDERNDFYLLWQDLFQRKLKYSKEKF